MQIDSYVAERQKKRKRKRQFIVIAGAIVALYLVVFGVIWFLGKSPIFRMNSLVIEGNQVVANEDIMTLLTSSALRDHSLLKGMLGFNNMLAWPSAISSSELELMPQLADVALTKNYFSHSITATVSERQPFGIWCFMKALGGEQCYWFDKDGTIFEKAFDAQGNLIWVVHDDAQDPRGLNEKVLPDEFVANMISILNVLHQSGIGVNNISLKDLSLEEINVSATQGPDLYFSLRFLATSYLPVIENLMQQPGFDKLQYIDCRTENRVYYK